MLKNIREQKMPLESLPSMPKNGRVNQKKRTRRELLRGARELMQEAKPVTVASAAKRAGISTATAYRYFSDPETLRLESVIEMDLGSATDVHDELHIALKDVTDPTERLIVLHQVLVAFVRRNEAAYRLFLAKGHEQIVSDKQSRKNSIESSRRLAYIEHALEPLRDSCSHAEFQERVHICATACGPEPYFVLKDFSNLSDPEIDRICELNLRTLTKSALIAA
ncbi:MAG: TetR/AcrR family transcriptional regulator [Litoreibacter sp.]